MMKERLLQNSTLHAIKLALELGKVTWAEGEFAHLKSVKGNVTENVAQDGSSGLG